MEITRITQDELWGSRVVCEAPEAIQVIHPLKEEQQKSK